MILLDIKQYIKQHHDVTLSDIKNHFDLTDDAAKGMLSLLIKQGHVQSIDAQSCSTGQCSTHCTQSNQGEQYLWRDKCFVSLSIPVQVV